MTVLPLLLATLLSADAPPVEICRFAAGDRDNPFRRWLASREVVCSSSSTLPAGLWNVFAKSENAISATATVEGEKAPELPLMPAATLTVQLPPKARAVVYAPRLGSAYPIAERALVPAKEPLWLFVIEHGVFPIGPIEAGATSTFDARGAAPPAVIGWLEVPESDRRAIRSARGLASPGVFARASGVTRDADVLPPLELLHGAFVRFTNVPAGAGELVLQGRGWMTDRVRVNVDPATTLVAQPLAVRASGSIIVGWTAEGDLAALDRSLGACRENEVAKGEITISSCPTPERAGPDPEKCTAIRKEPFDPAQSIGSFTIDEVPPGTYHAEFKYGKLPPVSTWGLVVPLQQRRLSLWVGYRKVEGRLTRGGEPLGEDATLTKPGVYAFARAETSEYAGVMLPGLSMGGAVQVTACGGDPRVLVLNDDAQRPGSSSDVDIPANELTVTVTDTFTRETLPGASIRIDVFTRRGGTVAVSRTAKSGEAVRAVPPDHKIVMQVTHRGYHKRTLDPFSMSKTESKELEVQLVPLRGTEGKIASQRPFENATLMWFSPKGAEIERVDVAADGTFNSDREHGPGEIMTVVSSSHPLWVTRASRSMSFAFPDAAPPRRFDLRGAATVVIGGVAVPETALRMHQALRRLPMTLLRDIAETAPIEIVY